MTDVDVLDRATPAPPTPTPRLRPPLTRQRVLLRLVVVGFLAATVWGWWYIDMSFTAIFSGLGDMWNLLGRMFPPDFEDLDRAIELTFETLWMAVIGTAMAIVLSVPLAFGAARNTTPHPAVMAVCRGVIVATRAIPDLIFAAIFVRAVGIGVLPGILALGLHSIGMVGKLFADAIEQIDERPRDAVVSVGATKWQAIVTSVLPQVMPSMIATTLYRLDINLRSSTVLGIVGAGGVGFLLQQKLRSLQYDQALAIVVVIFVFITLMEFLSAAVRSTLLGADRAQAGRRAPRASVGAALFHRFRKARPESDGMDPFDRATVRPPFVGERRVKAVYGALFAALLGYALWAVRLDPVELFQSIGKIWEVTLRLFPPDFSTAGDGIWTGMLESIAVAFVATFLGTIVSVPLGLLAARNVAVNRTVYAISRVFIVFLRGIPELIVAVLFVSAIGLGPVAGSFALVVGTAGFFAKLIADAVEEVDPIPREAVFATGATRLQETGVSVLPQAMPSLVGNLLYVLDINLRVSTVLGIVGGGGIGFLLFNSLRVLQWQTTGAILIVIFVVVYAIELLAGWVRKQIL
ncbi:phosphonate ABC transporter, permease protein PhnE [Ilumatobacter nonamiensis]|uniref:phosphonate ABC transporter, permease protein PhnE n=1 Tax=Ilumatobacter nonamiensis TaxID=467093 RepID=UPI00034A92E9|nr:phosphonate ABC transporter, permease protein PhnE [Ilumatobacter nonamiensis]